MTGDEEQQLRPLEFIGSSRKDLVAFPDEARQDVGHALYLGALQGLLQGQRQAERLANDVKARRSAHRALGRAWHDGI